LLEKNALGEQIFAYVRKYLQDEGLMMQEGTIVDATILKSPSSTKNKEKQRDPEMTSTRKNGTWFFGMKAHVGVDKESGLVHSCEVSTAKITDREKFADLLHGKENAVYGDKGYVSKIDRFYAKDAGVYWGVMDRGSHVKSLTLWQKKRNHLLAKIRAKVEHPFRVVKHLWGHTKTRYRGLYKNHNQLYMLFTLSNLYMVRNQVIQET
jgi:transposase, IS5 family